MVLFVFVIAWAIMGAAEETWGDARTGVRGARTRARQSASRKFQAARTHRSAAVRWPAHAAYGTAKTGAGVWYGTKATGRGVRHTGRSLRTGWTAGAARGRERHAAYVQRQRERASRPYASFGFPDASEPARESTADVKPQTRTADPTDEPDTSTDADPTPTPDIPTTAVPETPATPTEPSQEEGTDMTMPTGEANSYEQTQAAFKQITALAQEFVGTVDNLQGSLQTANLDSETLGECAEIIDAAQTVQATAEKALNGLESRHSQLHEAISSASVEPADTGWYRG